jgi:oligopeptidase B
VRDLRTNSEETVKFDEEAYSLGMSVGYEFDTSVFRLTYSSPTTPSRTYDVDLDTGIRTLLKEQEVPSGHNPPTTRPSASSPRPTMANWFP